MTLLNLVSLYSGVATFEVSRAIDGGIEDVISFESDDYGAVKDSILAENVMKYSCAVGSKMVVILEAAADTTTTDTTPTTPEAGE